MSLTTKQRKQILAAIRKRILKSHFNVAGVNYDAWLRTLDARTEQLMSGDTDDFEAGVQDILKDLGSSHTGFFHERPSRLYPQHTINATLGKFVQDEQPRWFFLDVFEEGPADRAVIKPGDVLHEVDGVGYAPPDMPPLRTGVSHELFVSAPDGSEARRVLIAVPRQKGNKDLPPILPPKSISSSMIEKGIGLVRITWFPGAMGLGFAKSLDAAVTELKRQGCDRLIVDLRGNIGGGLGFARLASYCCPGKVPIGYSVTPKRARKGYRTEDFERVVYPSSRLGFASTLGRFAFRDKSIFLLTQGLGPQPFHGGIVLLVNEWTNSAAEMVVAFAAEHKSATIVGSKTAGNLLGAVNVKVGSGYWLRLPVFGWYTNMGSCVEGRGVTPDTEADVNPHELARGIDRQMITALDICRSFSKETTPAEGSRHSAAF